MACEPWAISACTKSISSAVSDRSSTKMRPTVPRARPSRMSGKATKWERPVAAAAAATSSL